jgi:hypothetical protein
MKAYWGVEVYLQVVLWPRHYIEVSGQLHVPAALPQGKSPCYQLDMRLGGPQSRSGRGGEKNNPQPLPDSKPGSPIIQSVDFGARGDGIWWKFHLSFIRVGVIMDW